VFSWWQKSISHWHCEKIDTVYNLNPEKCFISQV
jgi:hypothetical protein